MTWAGLGWRAVSGCCEEGRHGDGTESGRAGGAQLPRGVAPRVPAAGHEDARFLTLRGRRRWGGAPENSRHPQGTSAAAVPYLPDSDGRAHRRAGEAGGVARVSATWGDGRASRGRGHPSCPLLDGPEEAGAAPRPPPRGRLLPQWLVSPVTHGLSVFSVLFKIRIFSLPFVEGLMKESLYVD